MRLVAPLAIAIVLLTSCVEYRERMWINGDGSGKIEMRAGYDIEMTRMGEGDLNPEKLFKLRSETDEITNFKTDSDTTEGKVWFEAKFRFNSTEFTRHLNEDTRKFVGVVKLKPNDDGNLNFVRMIHRITDRKTSSQSENPFAESMFGESAWVYETHFPSKILKLEVTEGTVEQIDKSVKWTIPMSKLAQKIVFLRAEIEPADHSGYTPRLLITISASIALLILIVFYMNRVNNRSRVARHTRFVKTDAV